MVGVINPDSSVSLAKQKQLASESAYMLAPGQPFPSESGIPDGDVEPQISTSTSVSPPALSTTGSRNNKLSSGAIAGITIACIFSLLIISLLFFLLGRQKSILQVIRRNDRYHRSLSDCEPMRISSPLSSIDSSRVTNPLRTEPSLSQSAPFIAAPPYAQLTPTPPRPTRPVVLAELASHDPGQTNWGLMELGQQGDETPRKEEEAYGKFSSTISPASPDRSWGRSISQKKMYVDKYPAQETSLILGQDI